MKVLHRSSKVHLKPRRGRSPVYVRNWYQVVSFSDIRKTQMLKDNPGIIIIFSLLSTNPIKTPKPTMHLSLSDFLFVALSSRLLLKTWIFKNSSQIILFQFYQTNRRKRCICWGLFSAADESAFGALVSIWGSMTVCVGLNQNKLHWCVFNSFWTIMELYGTQGEDISVCDTHNTC